MKLPRSLQTGLGILPKCQDPTLAMRQGSVDSGQVFHREGSLASIFLLIGDDVLPGLLTRIPSKRVEPSSDSIVEFEPDRVVFARAYSWDGFRSQGFPPRRSLLA